MQQKVLHIGQTNASSVKYLTTRVQNDAEQVGVALVKARLGCQDLVNKLKPHQAAAATRRARPRKPHLPETLAAAHFLVLLDSRGSA